jgi:hypothetical protein
MAKPLQGFLKWVYKKFSEDAPGMIITTSAIGWLASMAAQVLAITMNPKIKEEQKVFLIPQEFNDALLNIGTFLVITLFAKNTVSRLFSTGKFASKSVKEYIAKHPKIYEGKIGKVGFDLGNSLKHADKSIYQNYETYKNLGTTVATVGAGVLAANVITPIIRNKLASRVQKTYINEFMEPKAGDVQAIQPSDNSVNKPNEVKKAVPAPQLTSLTSRGSMRI